MKKINFIKKIQIISLLFILTSMNALGFENKILVKIENEIITTIDLYNHVNYITSLNPEIKKLEYVKILEIAKNNLIREKIKKKEVLKIFKNIDIKEKDFDSVIKSIFYQQKINNAQELSGYLETIDLNFLDIKEKISIEILWNQLIYDKFASKIKIDKEKLKEEILNRKKKLKKSYLLSEILFNIDNKSQLENKTKNIYENIEKNGFKNTALAYSISASSISGGELGWIDEDFFIKEIKQEISKIKIGEHTKPILTQSGFLILMVNDIKEVEQEINIDQELSKIINLKANQQLDQFSNIYFEKIKKDISINEL